MNGKIIEYDFVEAEISEIKEHVNRLIRHGWEPYEAPIARTHSDGFVIRTYIGQPMVRREPQQEETKKEIENFYILTNVCEAEESDSPDTLNVVQFKEVVKTYLSEGWELYGELQAHVVQRTMFFIQTLVKYKKPTVPELQHSYEEQNELLEDIVL